jgi:hypothetical protein
MSLTSHLKNPAQSPIGQFFRQRFLHTAAITRATNPLLKAATTIRPAGPHPYPYGTVGTALDYRIRYSFAITPSRELVAWFGAWNLLSVHDRWEVAGNELASGRAAFVPPDDEEDLGTIHYPATIITGFFDRLDTLLERIQPVGQRLDAEAERELSKYCFVLALFEEVYRSTRWEGGPLGVPSPKGSIEELLAIPGPAVIDDVCQLSSLFYDQFHGLLARPHILNPTFKGSGDVGGADADLIVDGCLIDIKTSISPTIESEWLRQIVGYALLDYDDERQITSLGIYMARQGRLFTWPLAYLLVQLTGDPTATVESLRQELRVFRDFDDDWSPGGATSAILFSPSKE